MSERAKVEELRLNMQTKENWENITKTANKEGVSVDDYVINVLKITMHGKKPI